MNCLNMLKVILRSERVKFGCFSTFCQFSQKRSDNFSLCFVYSFLGMILIICQEMDLIDYSKGHFQGRKGRAGVAHFPIITRIT